MQKHGPVNCKRAKHLSLLPAPAYCERCDGTACPFYDRIEGTWPNPPYQLKPQFVRSAVCNACEGKGRVTVNQVGHSTICSKCGGTGSDKPDVNVTPMFEARPEDNAAMLATPFRSSLAQRLAGKSTAEVASIAVYDAMRLVPYADCTNCVGRGKVGGYDCMDCNGSGEVRVNNKIDPVYAAAFDRVNEHQTSYADHPRSVTELKSERSDKCSDWTPRDVLISLLREIDSGEFKPIAIFVTTLARNGDTDTIRNTMSAESRVHAVYLANQGVFNLMNDKD